MSEPDIIATQTLQAEQSVLGSLMLDCAALDRLNLKPGDFFFAHNRRVFAAIKSLSGSVVDPITVSNALGADADDVGGLQYLNALAMTVPSARHVDHYAKMVREKAGHRMLKAVASRASEIADGDGSIDEKLDAIHAELSSIAIREPRTAARTLSDIALQRVDHYDRMQRGEAVAGLPTGFSTLDGMLSGGLRPGMVYVVAARPSVGKSSWSQLVCTRMARQSLPTIFLSQEMSAEELADRAVSNAGRIDYGSIMSGRMSSDDWHRAVDALEGLAPLPMYIDDQGSLTLADIKAKARSVKGLKVLCLDYIQLCQGTRRDGNRNAEIEEVSRGLKALAKELDIAVIVLSQLNREVEKRANKRPQMADLRDSGAIEQDADVIVFLWHVRDLGEHQRIVGCAVEKNRAGRRGAFGLAFFGATQEWEESAADINPPQRAKESFE